MENGLKIIGDEPDESALYQLIRAGKVVDEVSVIPPNFSTHYPEEWAKVEKWLKEELRL